MEIININAVPNTANEIINASQNDNGRVIRCYLFDDGGLPYKLSGTELVKVVVRTPDGEIVEQSLTNTSSNYVDVVLTGDMTKNYGRLYAKVHVITSSTDIGMSGFFVDVESKPKTKIVDSTLPIFNKEDIEGLNPLFADGIIQYYQSNNPWSITTEKMSKPNSSNNAIEFYGVAIPKDKYHKLCIEVEVPDGSTGNYNIAHVGIRYNKINNYLDGPDIYIPVTDCYEHINCAGTTPWYRLARCVAEVDISEATDDFYLCIHACDNLVNIYSIWLE